jgi:hypothetical protein
MIVAVIRLLPTSDGRIAVRLLRPGDVGKHAGAPRSSHPNLAP